MVEACHNLACRRHGMADDYLKLHAQTHQLMKYYVRHCYGISTEYNTLASHPWHGAGQGAADAALHYIALSDSLIDTYHSHFQPCVLKDPHSDTADHQKYQSIRQRCGYVCWQY